jgi:phosphoribosylanthranilate isomerase
VQVKICGITRLEDAVVAAELGADMLGFNFYPPSPRSMTPADAAILCDQLRAELGDETPALVGVFVNMAVSEISRTMEIVGLDFAQLSGDESDEMLLELRGVGYKAVRPPNKALAMDDASYYQKAFTDNPRIPSLLLDAYHPKLYGGTGEAASVDVALAVREIAPRMMLAGGLRPENVAERVQAIRPWGVDVASGVEPQDQPGIKDVKMMAAFIEAARSA